MTSPRLARGGKGRIFIYLGAVLLLTGIIAIFHNTQQQLDDVKKNEQLCQQQQESLAAQMQVIIEYKARLEKSLQSERASHLQSQSALEAKIQDEKVLREKHASEDSLRLTTLQQHYKLLKSQHEDLEEECANTNKQHVNEINVLKTRLQDITKQLKLSNEKNKTLEKLENENKQLLIDSNNFQRLLKENQNELDKTTDKLKKEIYHLHKQLDSKCDGLDIEKLRQSSILGFSTPNQSARKVRIQSFPTVLRDFSKQVQLEKDVYQIRTNANKPFDYNKHIINSVENFQIYPKTFQESMNQLSEISAGNKMKEDLSHVLQVPNVVNVSTSTTPKTKLEANMGLQPPRLKKDNVVSSAKGDNTGEGLETIHNKDLQNMDQTNRQNKNVPAGVVPFPVESRESQNFQKQMKQDEKNSNQRSLLKQPVATGNENSNEKENGAHEVIDGPILDDTKFNDNQNNGLKVNVNDGIQNNAEEDMYNDKPFLIINQPVGAKEKSDARAAEAQKDNINGAPEMYPENAARHQDYPDEQRDVPLEGGPEEDDDADDYGPENKQDLAVRN